MKINVVNLLHGLSFVSGAYDKAPIQPQYSGVLLKNDGDTLTLRTTDLRSTAQIVVPCVTEKPFTTLVNFATLLDIANKTRGAKQAVISMSLGAKLTVTSDLATVRIPTMEPSLFPEFTFAPEEDDITLSVDDFQHGLSCSQYCHNDRVPLIGVHFGNVVEATDGFFGKQIDLETPFSRPVTIPKQAVAMLKKITGDKVQLQERENALVFYGDAWFVSVQVLGGDYPDTRMGYQNSGQNVLSLHTEELKQIVEVLTVVGDTLHITVDYNTVTLSSGDDDAARTIEISDGEMPNRAIVDIKMFLQIIKDVRSSVVTVILGTRDQPLIIEDDNAVFFCVQHT